MSSYDILIDKLDRFARKFYLNKILRGSLILLTIFVTLFLLFNFLEFQFYLPSGIRTVVAYGFVLSLLAFAYLWVINPLLKYFRLGARIDYKQSAEIIGEHFVEIKDKLLNILQLKELTASSSDLVMASIQQKADEIKLVPFQSAIDLNTNRKYLPFALVPVLALLVLMVKVPSMIKDSTYRYINNQQEFVRQAPFSFVFNSPEGAVVQFTDIPINLKMDGDKLPAEVSVLIDGYKYRMDKKSSDRFHYLLTNIQDDTKLQFEANGFLSETFDIKTILRPKLLDFRMALDYPNYTKKPNETLDNVGNAIVPVGTTLRWTIKTENADIVHIEPFELDFSEGKSNSKRIYQSTPYSIVFGNSTAGLMDSLLFNVGVISDLRPSISVKQFVDSSNLETDVAYFAGEVTDDYGVSALYQHKEIYTSEGQLVFRDSADIGDLLDGGLFSYQLSTKNLGLSPGQYAQVFFVAFDNDAINGRKSSRSQIFTFNKQSIEELKIEEEIAEDDIIDKATELKQQQLLLKKAAEELRNDLLQQKDITWQDEKKLDEIIQQQKNIDQDAEELKDLLEKLQEQQEEYKDVSEETQEQQEKLEELVEQANDDKLEDLLEKIKDLFEKKKKNEAISELEQTQTESEQKEMDYERLLELYKKLEVETDMQDKIDELNQLAEEQKQLSEQEQPDEQKQEEIKEQFEKLEKEMEDIKEKNENLKRPMDIPDTKGDQQEIKMNMDEAQKNSSPQGDQKKRQEAQQKAAEQMQKMADQMQNSMQSSQQEQLQEDIKMVRQLLENLVTLSFDEELVFSHTSSYNPRSLAYKNLVQDQHKIKQDWSLVKDSLIELSLRQPKIESFITENITEIDKSMNVSIDFLEDHQTSTATVHERRIMTFMNELALMLDESLQNMQQSLANQSSNPNKMCNNPNKAGANGKPMPNGKISQGQKQLTEQMMKKHEEYKKAQQEGKKMGEGKGSEKGKNGTSSKDFAEMAAEQAALRKALEEKMRKLQEKGKGDKQLQNIIDEMDKTETELVNKQLTNEMLKRQQDIITRLLEAEEAERQQEWDDKRESRTADQLENNIPKALEEYLKKRQGEKIEYKTLPAELKPFYQRLVEQYYDKLKS